MSSVGLSEPLAAPAANLPPITAPNNPTGGLEPRAEAEVQGGDYHQFQDEYDDNDNADTRGRPQGQRQEDANADNSDNENGDGDDDHVMSIDELLYGMSSFHEIAKPVTITMMLAASAAIFVNTEQSLQMAQAELAGAYTVWKLDDSQQGRGELLALSLGNALVICLFIGALTFGIVLLYKFRFMSCLLGYMVLSSAALLGILGGDMMELMVDKYRWGVDVLTFYFCLYNFAVVGPICIFFPAWAAVPTTLTQAYLICTSVILAWHLSRFDVWTIWTLLVMLALYDLCAVLTPCGPLKALVHLMQKEDAPEMPGLLYEAELPTAPRVNTAENPPPPTATPAPTTETPSPRRATLPLAIAKTYRLTLLSPIPPAITTADGGLEDSARRKGVASLRRVRGTVSSSPLLETAPEEEEPQQQQQQDDAWHQADYHPSQLVAEVLVELPANGGRVEKHQSDNDQEVRYQVFNRNGELRRTLVVDPQGAVFEVSRRRNNDNADDDTDSDSADDDDEEEDKLPHSIRLGLGDFIFYSVLVAKAAMYSFATFAACTLVILAGLGGTLILLAVYRQALPALPISIFLGVLFYLLTRIVMEPWMEGLLKGPYYV